ncbi:hypothetical protein SBOR_0124 [Sclerotinia borealis F-4128]|uniref:Uncharacterized protein n=1 Tax=Sclerotinia borealis (strain F-4128) TaxID=1432307 RepID=W9CY11_SCLBF|nr:hypothetical protein SBOR_0124 [Sclerotinia borealis F-4128]
MKQPAPIRGERMETLIIQTLIANTPVDPDIPSRSDTRTEQHITVDLPDSNRHSSDPNRYLINRNNPIGGHGVKLSDIEADTYDDYVAQIQLGKALKTLESKDGEKPMSRKKLLRIVLMMKELVSGLIEDRETRSTNIATWVDLRKSLMDKLFDSRYTSDEASGNTSPDDGEDDDEEKNPKALVERVGVVISAIKHQTGINEKLLKSLEDVEDSKYQRISDAMRARGFK